MNATTVECVPNPAKVGDDCFALGRVPEGGQPVGVCCPNGDCCATRTCSPSTGQCVAA